MEPQYACAPKFISFWIFLNCEFWGNLPVDEVWIEHIELVALDHLQSSIENVA